MIIIRLFGLYLALFTPGSQSPDRVGAFAGMVFSCQMPRARGSAERDLASVHRMRLIAGDHHYLMTVRAFQRYACFLLSWQA